MSRVAFHLPDAVSQRLQKLAARTGRSETEYMIEAIREYLDDLEDVHYCHCLLYTSPSPRDS